MKRPGIFLCSGCGIGEAVKLEGLAAAAELGNIPCTIHPCLCAPEPVAAMRGAVEKGELDGLLVGACSARAKVGELTMRLELAEYLIEKRGLMDEWKRRKG